MSLTDETRVTTDIQTLIKVGGAIIAIAIGWYSLKADNARLADQLREAMATQKVAEARLATVERTLVELTVTLKIKGVTP